MSAPLIIALLRGLCFGWTLPLWVAHLNQRGVGLLEIGVLGTAFEFCKLMFEIPMGGVADKIGERPALFLSSALMACTWFGLALATDMRVLIALMFTWAVGEALFSGTYESWISSRSGKSDFGSQYSRVLQVYSIGLIAGALQSSFSPTAQVFLFASIASAAEFTIYPFARFPEPLREGRENALSVVRIVREGLKESLSHVSVRRILLIAFITGFAYDGIDRFWQPLALQRGFQIHSLGPLYAAANALSICMLHFARKREALLQSSNFVRLLDASGIVAIAGLLILPGPFMLAALVLLLSIEGVRNLVLKNVINIHFPESRKATLFSIFSGFGAFGELFAGAGFGFVGARFGLVAAFVLAGALLTPVILLYPRRFVAPPMA